MVVVVVVVLLLGQVRSAFPLTRTAPTQAEEIQTTSPHGHPAIHASINPSSASSGAEMQPPLWANLLHLDPGRAGQGKAASIEPSTRPVEV